MGDVNTNRDDEITIDQVLANGFRTPHSPNIPKYRVLRLALAKSLRMEGEPEQALDTVLTVEKGSEYSLEQVTGLGRSEDTKGMRDFDAATRALLSVYHHEDLFASELRYKTLLQRHIRRGLREIRTSWNRGHNFAVWLREELLPAVTTAALDSPPDTDKLLAALQEIGVHAEIRSVKQGCRLDRYALFLADIHHLDALKRGLDKLAFRLGIPDDSLTLSLGNEAGIAALDVPRGPAAWRPVPVARLQQWAGEARQEKLPVWLGQTVLGEDFFMDLAEAPHLLIAGTTGSGKTVCLHSLICSLLSTLTPQTLQLALIDPKGTELNGYADLPNLYGGKVAKSVLDAAELLNALVEEMESRNRRFAELGVRNIDDAQGKVALSRIVLVVEELADLLMQSDELEAPLVRLAQKARSAGIHLVLATQRPDAATFSGLLRSNIPTRIALRVQKHTESSIILDQKGAEALLGKGDMLVKTIDHPEPVRVHGANVGDADIARAVRDFHR
ncbi:MAG: DNA translocase FtsK [Methylococcaceae bacterium]|nr:MAG: DNA translocase FtsK [Methylococcaceae bacterium]